jgi:hypothetical protein
VTLRGSQAAVDRLIFGAGEHGHYVGASLEGNLCLVFASIHDFEIGY